MFSRLPIRRVLTSPRRALSLGAVALAAVLHLYWVGGWLLACAPVAWALGLTSGLYRASGGNLLNARPGRDWSRRAVVCAGFYGCAFLPVVAALLWYGMFASLSIAATTLLGLWIGSHTTRAIRLYRPSLRLR